MLAASHSFSRTPIMTPKTARHLAVLALAPLLVLGALRPAAEAEAGAGVLSAPQARLELASLKAEARSLSVHIDGP